MRRPLKIVLLGLLVAVVLVGAGVGLLVLRDGDAPDEVALSSTTSTPPAAAATSVPAPPTPDGTWAVRAGETTFAGYRVTEQFASVASPVEAVGRSPLVTGTMTIAAGVVESADLRVGLQELSSDEARRDTYIRGQSLESERFPEASFTLRAPMDLGDVEQGADVTATANGDLMLHGVTRPVAIDLEARWLGETIEVVGSLPIAFGDYGIDTPNIGGFVSVEDEGTMELSLVMAPG